jgi:hypothetical protein
MGFRAEIQTSTHTAGYSFRLPEVRIIEVLEFLPGSTFATALS